MLVYIRWKTRQNRTGEIWYACLCTSERIEGKPTSTTLGYLSSTRADLLPVVPAPKAFWQQVKENLKLHYLPKPERLKIDDVCCNYCAVES
jgi:hypothetical protein